MFKRKWQSIAIIVAVLSLLLGAILPLGNLGQAGQAQAATAKTDPYLTKIKQKGTLVLGLSADYPPYEFHKTVNGQDTIIGFDVDIAKKIAKDMGVHLVIKEMGFDALLGALKTGKIDMIISGMSETPERAKEVTFSEPYLTVQQAVMTRKNDVKKFANTSSFNGVKVGAQKQTTQEQLAHDELNGAKVVSLQKMTDLVLNLQQKKIDAIVIEKPVADAYVEQDSALGIVKSVKFANATKQTAVALPKDAPALTAQVNKSITTIKKDKLLAGYIKNAQKQMFSNTSFFEEYGSYFVKGTGITIALTILGVLFGTVLGTILALMKRAKNFLIHWIAVIYIEYFRGTPLLVQVFMIYFGTQIMGLDLSAFVSAAIALSLNSGAYVSEIIRSGINSVPIGQTEAARSLGITSKDTTRFVVLPQAVRTILPALGNEFISLLKESAIVSVIGVGELMFQTGVVQGASFKPFSPLVLTSFIYFALTLILSAILSRFEKRMNLGRPSNQVLD
ncbi:amino acid ABC transporter, permease protein [Agrilactobacillus composti DSM 18527 = JCM 14202]|uniref:Amino acid ABC transporter, permease protein n=1 Tax=Agrilactobacillus composti DSM 18527 = JCM 14202 TaxID=1423734 RepID=X0PVN3_9LACO|nr:ABC transporter substrate-binding protein/permease [Agrilactobacillus composti]KRM35958.1 amino acid ABC transporter, permease protein [Agrilactobacillus composti DSM 18527 = JCM 14202]GAF41541.1 amino acid ABC transporter, amino acid-binding/permease protein [Agrilactobacillus composti DSM 18527 = JCM 14202]